MVPAHDTCGPILVVDSDLQTRAVVARLLLHAGYATRMASTAAEALESAQKRRPRLVLIEVALPDVSGFELCHELRDQCGRALPIMFLSRRGTDPLDRVAGLLLGADDYLAKPFIPDELLARVAALTRRSEPTVTARFNLTRRELEVLVLLTEGLGQTDIADQLVVSRKTVGNHIEHILRKLGVHSRAQAVACAYREHLV
jgi:two-component system, NarL family, nitrate/nitrite response regulator NarL